MEAPLSKDDATLTLPPVFSEWLTALIGQGYELVDYDKLPDPNRAEDCPEEADEQSRLDDRGGSERAIFTIAIENKEVRVVSGLKASGTGWRVWPAARLLAACLNTNAALVARTPRILELGAGCGLVGCIAAKITRGEVLITDYKDAIVSRISRAIELSGLSEGRTSALLLDWTKIPPSLSRTCSLVLGSDLIYSLEAGDTLALAVSSLCAPSGIFLGCFSHYRVGFAEFARNIRRSYTHCAYLYPPRSALAKLRSRFCHWVFVLAASPPTPP